MGKIKSYFIFFLSVFFYPILADVSLDVKSLCSSYIPNYSRTNFVGLNHSIIPGYKKETENYNVDLNLLLRYNSKENPEMYVGKNLYIYYGNKETGLYLGRKESKFFSNIFSGWHDGNDGLTLYKKWKDAEINLSLVDFYSGYKLVDKYYLLQEYNRKSQSKDRARSSILVNYNVAPIQISFLFSYWNLMNWGTASNDEAKPTGDKDFFYHSGLTLTYSSENWNVGLLYMISQGMDKTQYIPTTKSRSIPIQGELLGTKFGAKYLYADFSFSLFLPDGDKRNKQGEVTEIGFIGSGSFPNNSYILQGELNYYPSNWVTPFGTEKNYSLLSARRNSFWLNPEFKLNLSNFVIQISYNYYLPLKKDGASTGGISFQKKDYEKFFISELSSSVFYKDFSANYSIGIIFGTLISNYESHLKSQFISIQGGIQL